jgi:GDP/UDP-N,N'-diacetylbacillosamine 2-epimerase (hydrolysing)
LEGETAILQFGELLAALETLDGTQLIFTMPNADTEGRALRLMIQRFVEDHANARAFTSLGQQRYLSCMRHVDGVVGNSSSGLIEAPALRKGTINIGGRQRGRLKAESVIDCAANRDSIREALGRLYESDFQLKLATVRNPYGGGGASKKVVRLIRESSLDGILEKAFHDLPSTNSSNGPAGTRRS